MAATLPQNIPSASDPVICPVLSAHVPQEDLSNPPSYHCCCLVTKSCPTFATPWTAARQSSLSFPVSWSLLKLMSIELPYWTMSWVAGRPTNALSLGHVPPPVLSSVARVQSVG